MCFLPLLFSLLCRLFRNNARVRTLGSGLGKWEERGSWEGKDGEKEQTMNEMVLFLLSPHHHLNLRSLLSRNLKLSYFLINSFLLCSSWPVLSLCMLFLYCRGNRKWCTFGKGEKGEVNHHQIVLLMGKSDSLPMAIKLENQRQALRSLLPLRHYINKSTGLVAARE